MTEISRNSTELRCTAAEIPSLPTNVEVGTICLVYDTSAVLEFEEDGQWHEL